MADHTIPLLPCPWCGSENIDLIDDGGQIACNDCGAHGPDCGQNGDMEAVAAWNKGPYADRLEIHAEALKAHANRLKAEADERLKKSDELLKKVEVARG